MSVLGLGMSFSCWEKTYGLSFYTEVSDIGLLCKPPLTIQAIKHLLERLQVLGPISFLDPRTQVPASFWGLTKKEF